MCAGLYGHPVFDTCDVLRLRQTQEFSLVWTIEMQKEVFKNIVQSIENTSLN